MAMVALLERLDSTLGARGARERAAVGRRENTTTVGPAPEQRQARPEDSRLQVVETAVDAGLGVDTKGFGTFTMADQSAGSQPEELLDTLQQDQSGDSAAAGPPAPPAKPSGRRR